jgi:hypothetical protein
MFLRAEGLASLEILFRQTLGRPSAVGFLLWSYRQVFQVHGSQAWVAWANDRHLHVPQRIASGALIADQL